MRAHEYDRDEDCWRCRHCDRLSADTSVIEYLPCVDRPEPPRNLLTDPVYPVPRVSITHDPLYSVAHITGGSRTTPTWPTSPRD